MSTFDDRENAFENKFAHDAEMQFKAEARRNKLLGLWAAELMGKSGSDAEDYAKEVIRADFEEAGDEDVYRKVSGDLEGKADEKTIRAKMSELMTVAKAQLMEELPE
ncbi:MAG: aldolase [Maritimibacter sp.]|nr:aldolase [Maritimibacter sp.]